MASGEADQSETDRLEDTQGVFSELGNALETLRKEEFTWDEDINFLQSFLRDPHFKALTEVNDRVANSIGFENPVGSSERPFHELQGSGESASKEESELLELLTRPFVKSLLTVHDTVRTRSYESPLPSYDPNFHPQSGRSGKKGVEYRTIGLHKSANEPLGITLKLVNHKLIIARILHGGLIYRQGLLQVGDRIVEVNQESVDAMNPSDLQEMLKHSSGALAMKIEPGYQETAGVTEQFVRAHFDYNPRQDRLIPSQDAGMPFRRGDIIKILNQEDNFWWQAIKAGDHTVAGLIPSQILEERRKVYKLTDGHAFIGCMGKKKSKRKIMYSSHHSGEFENYDVVLYEPVMQVENFQYRSLVLIGAPNIGRRSLKTRLLSEWPDKFAEVKAHTTRAPKGSDDHLSFYFVTEEDMRKDIVTHKFIEFGKHQQNLYGVKADSILDVVNSKRMCVLDVHPQALKLLRTPQFRPLVVFVKAVSPDGVRKLHQSARVDNPAGHSMLSNDDYTKCSEESTRIEKLYGHYFDASIINENIDVAYEELMATIRVFSTGKHWIPANWVM